jgi:hypothetical protein
MTNTSGFVIDGWRYLQFLVFMVFLNLTGCVKQNINVSPMGKTYCPRGIVIKPFENQTGIPSAGIVVTDVFQVAVVRLGWPVLESEGLKDVLAEYEMQDFLTSSNSGQALPKNSKLQDPDVLIYGKVFAYQQGQLLDRVEIYLLNQIPPIEENMNTVVGFSAWAININNGSVLWSINVKDDGGSFSYNAPVQSHAIMVIGKAINELIKKGVNTK